MRNITLYICLSEILHLHLSCKTFIHRKYNKMATITAQQFSTKELKTLISEMILDSTLNSLQCYNKRIFENYEELVSFKWFICLNLTVTTDYRNHKIIIKDVDISGVELWESDTDEVFVSDEMLLIIKNEITNKVNNLI